MNSSASTAESRARKKKPEELLVNTVAVGSVSTGDGGEGSLREPGGGNEKAHQPAALADEWRATLAKQSPSSALARTPEVWQPLPASRVKHVGWSDAQRSNRLLAARLHGDWADGEGETSFFRWEVIESVAIVAPVYVTLGVAGEAEPEWRIGLSEHSSLLPWLPQSFASLSDAAKHLCLTVALSPLLNSLASTFALPTEVTGLFSTPATGDVTIAAPSSRMARVSIRVTRGDDALGDVVELVLAEEVLDSVLRRQARGFSVAALPALKVELPVCVAVANLSLQSILGMRVRDVVLFEHSTTDVGELPLFLCAGNSGISLARQHGALVVDHVFSLNNFSHEPEGFFMNQARANEKNEVTGESANLNTTLEDQSQTLVDVKSVPVTLQFEIGRVALTVEEISQLVLGSVVKLPGKLAPETVTIRANGRSFATGEIVHIDEQLGVRITALAQGSAPQ